MTSIRQLVLIMAESMDIGDSTYEQCPECGVPDKMSITRNDEGTLYHCFRDQCSTAGFIANDRAAPGQHKRAKVKPPKPYERALRPLTGLERVRFAVTNGLDRTDIERGRWKYAEDDLAYCFPVLDPHGYERGVTLRWYDGRAVKAMGFKDNPELPWQCWYVHGADFSRVVLVEDQVSALKLSRYCTAVALLGTHMNEAQATEIASVRPGAVTIALDEDATNTAYKLKRWYGLMYPHCDVVQLHKDIKDMSDETIIEALGI